VHRRISVNLAGRGLKDLDLEPFGQPKHVDRTDHACFGGLHRILLVVNRGCRTGEIENLVDLHEEGMGDVVAKELEARVIEQMLYVASCASEEVVDTEHLTTAFKQAVAQMGPEKSGTPRYKNPPFEMHPSLNQIKRSPQQDLRAGFGPAGRDSRCSIRAAPSKIGAESSRQVSCNRVITRLQSEGNLAASQKQNFVRSKDEASLPAPDSQAPRERGGGNRQR
jgi:hypothetical protein